MEEDSKESLKKKGGKVINNNDNDVTRISFENDNEETKIDIEKVNGSKSSSDKNKKKKGK